MSMARFLEHRVMGGFFESISAAEESGDKGLGNPKPMGSMFQCSLCFGLSDMIADFPGERERDDCYGFSQILRY